MFCFPRSANRMFFAFDAMKVCKPQHRCRIGSGLRELFPCRPDVKPKKQTDGLGLFLSVNLSLYRVCSFPISPHYIMSLVEGKSH